MPRRILVVYTSLAANARRLAHEIAATPEAVREEMHEAPPRNGAGGFRSALEGPQRRAPAFAASLRAPRARELLVPGGHPTPAPAHLAAA